MAKAKGAGKKAAAPLKISTSLFQRRKSKQSSSDSSSSDSSPVPSPQVTKKKAVKASPKTKAKATGPSSKSTPKAKATAKAKGGERKEGGDGKEKGESKKKVGTKKPLLKKTVTEKAGKGTKMTKGKEKAQTKKERASPKSKGKGGRARSPSSSNSETSSSSDDTSSSDRRSPSPPTRRAAAGASGSPKKVGPKKVVTKKVVKKEKCKVVAKDKGPSKKGSPAKVSLTKKSPIKMKGKQSKPKAKLKRMASLNAKAMLEATFSFESGDKRKSPAGTPTKSLSKTLTSTNQDHPPSATAPESLESGSTDFKPLTLLFSSVADSDFGKECKSPKSSGERKRKSSWKGSESPVRRESGASNGSLSQVGATARQGHTSDTFQPLTPKSEKEKSKSPAPRKKAKVMSSSVSTSTSPFDSGEEGKAGQLTQAQQPFGYDQHLSMIGDMGLQRNFTLPAPFQATAGQVISDDQASFTLSHPHQGSLKGRGSGSARDKSKAATPNSASPFGSTVYQPAGPLIEPHKTTVPAALLPDTVRIPSDLKVTYQPRPPPAPASASQGSRPTATDTKKSEGRGSKGSSSASKSHNKQILHQPYKSTAGTTSSASMTVTSSTKPPTATVQHQSATFIHSPLAVNSASFVATQGGANLLMGGAGGPLGGATGTLTQSAALSSHISPSSAIMTTGNAASPGSLYFGYGHQSPFAPSKFPMVPPDSFRAQSPFGSPYLYPQTSPQSPNYFMPPSFYAAQGLGTPSAGSGLSATRPLFHHPSVGSSVPGAPFYQPQPPPSAHPVSNYYVTAPPAPPPSHHSMQPSTAPGHAGPSPPNPSSQPACPCPTDSSPRNSSSTSSSSSSTNTNSSSSKVNRSLLRKRPPPQQPATSATAPPVATALVADAKQSKKPPQKKPTKGATRPKVLEPKTVRSKPFKKLLQSNLSSCITISPIPPPKATLDNAKTFTEQYSLPDDITITPIIMHRSESAAHCFAAYDAGTPPVPKPPKKKDIVHVIDTRSGESTTIAKHISINNIHRKDLNLPNVSSVKPNNAGNVGKISPSLDVIVLNSKQLGASGKVKGPGGIAGNGRVISDKLNHGRAALLISPELNHSERPFYKSQQPNALGKALLLSNSNLNLVQPLLQAKSENKNKAIRRKGLTLNECIDGLQRKKMRILADTNVSITNVTPSSVPDNNNGPLSPSVANDHRRLLSISIMPDSGEERPGAVNVNFKSSVTNGGAGTPRGVRKDVKPKQGAVQPSKRLTPKNKVNSDSDFSTKLLDCNDAVAAVSALLIPASSLGSVAPAPNSPPIHPYAVQSDGAAGIKKRQVDRKPSLKIKLFKSGTGKITTRSSSQTPKLRSRNKQEGEGGNKVGRGRSRLLIRDKDARRSDSSGSVTPNFVPHYDHAQGNGSSTLTTSNNHVILRIPKASDRQGKVGYPGGPSGNMTLNAMKKRAIVKPLSPSLINGAIQTLAMSNKKLPIHTHPRWSNGWRFEGKPFEAKVYIKNDDNPVLRRCYPTMRHDGGDVIRARDCVLLKSGPRKTDLPFVAKVAALFENPADGEMMFSLLWYYRPEHTDIGRNKEDMIDEIFASKHRDSNSVATIEDKCYVFTFNEYCRYKKRLKQLLDGIPESTPIVPLSKSTTETRVPVTNFASEIANAVWYGIATALSTASTTDKNAEGSEAPPSTVLQAVQMTALNQRSGPRRQLSSGKISPEVVFFCRRVYDYRQKRMLKNPS